MSALKKVFQLTDSYLLHVTVTHHDDDNATVLFQSQWLGAKNPDELQNRYQVTMTNDQWAELAGGLLAWEKINEV